MELPQLESECLAPSPRAAALRLVYPEWVCPPTPPTRRWDLFNPQITHVSHFSKSLKVNRAHKNKPAPAIHPLNLAKPCDVLRTHVSAAGQTSGGKELEQTNGDIERIYSASHTH